MTLLLYDTRENKFKKKMKTLLQCATTAEAEILVSNEVLSHLSIYTVDPQPNFIQLNVHKVKFVLNNNILKTIS